MATCCSKKTILAVLAALGIGYGVYRYTKRK